jgi:hypothetical protein
MYLQGYSSGDFIKKSAFSFRMLTKCKHDLTCKSYLTTCTCIGVSILNMFSLYLKLDSTCYKLYCIFSDHCKHFLQKDRHNLTY